MIPTSPCIYAGYTAQCTAFNIKFDSGDEELNESIYLRDINLGALDVPNKCK